MLLEGHLYYFTPFYFKDGSTPENKFFIILKNIGDKTIVASLPTSSNKYPSFVTPLSHGCVNINERRINCYIFQAKRIVCEGGFSFKVDTHVYGDKIYDYEMKNVTNNGTIQLGRDYELKGKLTSQEFADLIKCIISSDATKGRFKKLLSG